MKNAVLYSCLLLCLLASACQTPAPERTVIGPYWDLVDITPAHPSAPSLFNNGHPKRSIRFTPDSVYRYANATEREVIDIGPHTGDYILSYRYTQRNDSLFFGGGRYRIAYLSRNRLVLQRGTSRCVYSAALIQQKVKRKLNK